MKSTRDRFGPAGISTLGGPVVAGLAAWAPGVGSAYGRGGCLGAFPHILPLFFTDQLESNVTRPARRMLAGTQYKDGAQPSTRLVIIAIAVAAFSFAFQETSILTSLENIQKTLPGATTSTVSFLESGYLMVSSARRAPS